MLTRIDHIGIAVDDLDAAIALYEQRLVMPVVHREIAEEIGLELVLLDIGESHVELLAPVRAESMLAGFLAEHGPGLHHVAGRGYLAAALVLGAGFLFVAARGFFRRLGRAWARQTFVYSLVYLTALFAALMLDRSA